MWVECECGWVRVWVRVWVSQCNSRVLAAYQDHGAAQVIGSLSSSAREVDAEIHHTSCVMAADALKRGAEVVGNLAVPHRPVCSE